MSQEKLVYEAKRWFNTALDDLSAADILLKNKRFSHSCFLFQQAAEKALKALWYLEDAEPWGHSVLKLVIEFPGKDSFLKDLETPAAFLDKFYIPTRYPNGLPELIPSMVYTEKDARLCKQAALKIINKIKKILD